MVDAARRYVEVAGAQGRCNGYNSPSLAIAFTAGARQFNIIGGMFSNGTDLFYGVLVSNGDGDFYNIIGANGSGGVGGLVTDRGAGTNKQVITLH